MSTAKYMGACHHVFHILWSDYGYYNLAGNTDEMTYLTGPRKKITQGLFPSLLRKTNTMAVDR